ncbi:MAG: DUF4258 domain-containing protein [Taibaiella sp.]|nr:DUF4258 domain-containing protein [Taibaiella sp.]
MKIEFSRHALEQMELRDISMEMVRFVLNKPAQVIREDNNVIYQSVVEQDNHKYLVRIFVNDHKKPNVVITAYKTSKISKYYEGEI